MRRQLIALAATALGASLAAPATAREPAADFAAATPTTGATRADQPTVPTHRAVVTTRRSVASYWTPERMRGATPAPGPQTTPVLSERSVPLRSGRPLVVDPVAPAATTAGRAGTDDVARRKTIGERWRHPNTAVAKTSGKVFFTSGRRDYVCSAGVIAGRRKSVIATAGHCVFGERTHEWVRNFVFVPGYDNGRAPFGRYPARRLWTTPQFYNHQNWAYDVGFVRLQKVDGRAVGYWTGAQGVLFNSRRTPWGHAFGYPATAPRFHGRYLIHCAGDTSWYRGRERKQYRLHCRMNGGASGGPWLRKYQSNGLGYQFSVVSLVTDRNDIRPKINVGPYFGDSVRNAWRSAHGVG